MLGEHGTPQGVKGTVGAATAHPPSASAALRAAALALLCTLIAGLLAGGLAGRSATAPRMRPATESGAGLLALPPALRALASARLGADDPAYRLSAGSGTLVAASPAQGLQLRFGRSSIAVSSAPRTCASPCSGSALAARRARSARPRGRLRQPRRLPACGSREWYATARSGSSRASRSTPAGRAPPAPLTLSLALGGNARGRLSGRTSVTFGTRAAGRSCATATSSPPTPRARAAGLAGARGRRLLLRVAAHGARYPLRIDPLVQQGPKLTGQRRRRPGFGVSVALSGDGNTALVGGPGDNGRAGRGVGVTRSGSTWTQQGPKLLASDEVGEGDSAGRWRCRRTATRR